MSDIVERLRGKRSWEGATHAGILDEAADEIERLSKEVEQLRAVLRKIVDEDYPIGTAIERAVEALQEIARRALEGEG